MTQGAWGLALRWVPLRLSLVHLHIFSVDAVVFVNTPRLTGAQVIFPRFP